MRGAVRRTRVEATRLSRRTVADLPWLRTTELPSLLANCDAEVC